VVDEGDGGLFAVVQWANCVREGKLRTGVQIGNLQEESGPTRLGDGLRTLEADALVVRVNGCGRDYSRSNAAGPRSG
jgi:hypothetical protein